MKKVLKSRIFIVIITMIICISGTLYATTKYQASEVIYNASSGDSMTVNDALNNIYKITKLGNATASDIANGRTAVVQGQLITGINELTNIVDMHIASAIATSSSVSETFTPTQDTNSIIIGGRRYGGAFTVTIKDSSGTTIASQLITASADQGGYYTADYVDVIVVKCKLKKGQIYTLNVPSQGSDYKLYAFVIYP